MSKSSVRFSLVVVRLFMACTTFLLLTITVLQTEDPDGYQATHLFFMPRSTWEMDGGVAMLYAREQSKQAEPGQLGAWSAGPAVDQGERTAAVVSGPPVSVTSYSYGRYGQLSPRIQESSSPNNAWGNQVFVSYSIEIPPPVSVHYDVDSGASPVPGTWRADIPTPPPRS